MIDVIAEGRVARVMHSGVARRSAATSDRPSAEDHGETAEAKEIDTDDLVTNGADADYDLELSISDEKVTDLVQLFKLLSDETRLRILFYLSRSGELHVRALCERLEQSQPAVSHHLALLRVAGLIHPRREGKHNFYHIQPERFDEMLQMFFAAFQKDDESPRIELNGNVLSYLPVETYAMALAD